MSCVEVINPSTGELIGSFANDPIECVPGAMHEARKAQKVWSGFSFSHRANCIRKMKSYLSCNMEKVVSVICACTGKTRQDALATEVLPCVLACEWYASTSEKALRPQQLPGGSVLFFNKSNTLVYEPLGVVGIISPWNYPFSIPFGEIVMGLMAGNGILLKVASNVIPVGKLIEEVVSAGELPKGLFNHLILPGSECGPAFLSAGVDKLFFTGSVEVGKALMAEAANTLTPVSLELGGNDAMVVLKDANIERAVNCACWAGFQNAGQSCGGVERIFVEAPVYDRFVEQLCAKTKALRHGPGSKQGSGFDIDIGSMTTKKQYNTVMGQIQDALDKGAKIVAESNPVGNCSTGYYIPATVLVDCTTDMRVLREETFGPILPVIKVPNEREAIRLANDCSMALTSSVFSSNSSRAWRVALRLDGGVVSINDHLYGHGMPEAPWGGWKDSGIGRTHGYLGLKEMSNVKCINSDCLPLNRNLWWYPFSTKTYCLLTSALRFSAPRRFTEKLTSLFDVLRGVPFMMQKWTVPPPEESRKRCIP